MEAEWGRAGVMSIISAIWNTVPAFLTEFFIAIRKRYMIKSKIPFFIRLLQMYITAMWLEMIYIPVQIAQR